MPDTSPTPVDAEHVWIRTVPTDGRWCYHCAVAETQWNGDPCEGEGGIIKVEQKLIECRAELRSTRAAIGPDSERIRELEAENKKYKGALDEIDRMNPDDFRTGQGHLSAAFREVNFQAAFAHVCRVVNRTLHGIDSAEGPSR